MAQWTSFLYNVLGYVNVVPMCTKKKGRLNSSNQFYVLPKRKTVPQTSSDWHIDMAAKQLNNG